MLFESSDKSRLSLKVIAAWSQAWVAPTIFKTSFSPSFSKDVTAPSPPGINWFAELKSNGKLGASTTSVVCFAPEISSTKYVSETPALSAPASTNKTILE